MPATPTSRFWTEFNSRALDIERALLKNDAESLTVVVSDLTTALRYVDHRLNLNVYGPHPFRLGILAIPGFESIADAFVATNGANANWTVGVGLPDDTLEAIVVEDDAGRHLRIAYHQLRATVLVDDKGSATIVFVLDQEFDPTGDESHLYSAAAENVVHTLLGGWPLELEGSVMLPLSFASTDMQPVHTLAAQWQAAMRVARAKRSM